MTDLTRFRSALFSAALGFFCASNALSQQPPHGFFTNPLFRGGDPWIVYEDGVYIYSSADCAPHRDAICLKRSTTLAGIIDAPFKTVWMPRDRHDPNGTEIWAPEIHKLNGFWYIYYAADPKRNNERHRLFVLRAVTSDPLGAYEEADTGAPHGALLTSDGHWAIDPDVFTAADGRLYLAWSCTNFRDSRFPQRICLARMRDPEHLATDPVPISTPAESWETRGRPIQEGPVGYVRNGITYMTYSASASWIANDYAVGILQNTSKDLLNPAKWSKTGPIFDHHGLTYGPGSVVFIRSSEGTQYWNFYHAIESSNCTPAYDCRDIRMQRMWWTASGFPVLGFPINPGVPLPDPGAGSKDSAIAPDWGNAFGDAAEGLSTGRVRGKWTWPDASSVTATALEPGFNQIFKIANPNRTSFNVHAEAALSGTQTAHATYGIYCLYDDAANHADLLIDAASHSLITRAVVHGKPERDRSIPLPANFDFTAFHVLECSKSADTFHFRLDPSSSNRIELDRHFALHSGQMGVLVSGADATFRAVSVN